MTVVINLYGGPCSGKSTAAAQLFAEMKAKDLNCELVREFVKQWAWEGRKPVSFDQFYLFGNQSRLESSLYGKVDYIVTDCPVLITSYYAAVFGNIEQARCFQQMLTTYLEMAEDAGHTHLHYFLERTNKYDPKGRFESEARAREVDEEMKYYLHDVGLKFTSVPASDKGVKTILKSLPKPLR